MNIGDGKIETLSDARDRRLRDIAKAMLNVVQQRQERALYRRVAEDQI